MYGCKWSPEHQVPVAEYDAVLSQHSEVHVWWWAGGEAAGVGDGAIEVPPPPPLHDLPVVSGDRGH